MTPVTKTILNPDAGRGWSILEGSGVNQLIHSDGVCIDLGVCKLLYVSGKTASDEHGQLVGEGDIKEQTRQVLRNITQILQQAGGSINDIVRVRVFVVGPLSDRAFGQIHEARAEVFSKEHYPASTLVVVDRLVRKGALIEIDADAVIQS